MHVSVHKLCSKSHITEGMPISKPTMCTVFASPYIEIEIIITEYQTHTLQIERLFSKIEKAQMYKEIQKYVNIISEHSQFE